MYKKIFYLLFLGLFLVGCSPLMNAQASVVSVSTVANTPTATKISAAATSTALPSTTAIVTAAPDLSLLGLPNQNNSSVVLDFVETMCNAKWFTRGYDLPCPADGVQSSLGYVKQLDSQFQELPVDANILLVYSPQSKYETISSKYPAITVQKGDRFQVVLACRNHSFCDVEFVLDYYNADSVHVGLKNWHYLFTDEPLVIDYSLDSIAGETVQFDLAVRARNNPVDAYAVWIAPQIVRTNP